MSRKASSIAKGIAILMVLFHHTFYSQKVILGRLDGQPISFDPLSMGLTIDIARVLKVCVAVFVFITAYGTFRQISAKLDSGAVPTGSKGRFSARYALSHAVKLLISFQFVFLAFIALGFLFPEHNIFSVYGGKGALKAGFYMVCDFFGLAKTLGTPTFNATWWYMSYALLLIFMMPAFVYLARKIGSLPVLMLSFMLPLMAAFDMTSVFWRYMPTVALGMVCAQYDVFEALERKLGRPSVLKRIGGGLLCLIVLGLVLYLRKKIGYVWLFEAVGAMAICRFAQHIEKHERALNFLGKHSMNMFFMHTFFMSYYTSALIYSFYWFGFIFLALVLVSLGCSIVIELLKKLLRVNKLRDWAVARVERMTIFALER